MGISSAIEASRQASYRKAEHDIEASIGRAGNPFWGGIGGKLKGATNLFFRPLKVGGAWAVGGNYPTDDAHVKRADLPEDLSGTKYAEALDKVRDYSRESADLRAQSRHDLASGNLGGYFRHKRAARYTDAQKAYVILPDETTPQEKNQHHESPGLLFGLLAAGTAYSMQQFAKQVIGGMSASTETLGALSAVPLPAIATGTVLSVL